MSLHLLKLAFDTRALLAFARGQGLLHRELDDGYLVHAALTSSFGASAPAPFVLESVLDGRPAIDDTATQVVLAYSEQPLEALESLGKSELIRWERSESKPVPSLALGREVGFITRVIPTVRSRAAAPGHAASGRGEGREMDAFLATCFRAGEGVPVDRAEVYRDWLAKEFATRSDRPAGDAELTDFSLRAFRRIPLMRKEQTSGDGRKRHVLERPDAIITGTLRVTDASAFQALLARGVGRHRSFGFGMLLLRRV